MRRLVSMRGQVLDKPKWLLPLGSMRPNDCLFHKRTVPDAMPRCRDAASEVSVAGFAAGKPNLSSAPRGLRSNPRIRRLITAKSKRHQSCGREFHVGPWLGFRGQEVIKRPPRPFIFAFDTTHRSAMSLKKALEALEQTGLTTTRRMVMRSAVLGVVDHATSAHCELESSDCLMRDPSLRAQRASKPASLRSGRRSQRGWGSPSLSSFAASRVTRSRRNA